MIRRFRSAAERMSRGVVFQRRLPSEFGSASLYVSPEIGGLKYWVKSLDRVDPDLLRVVSEHVKPGARVWDVGANLGLFSFASAFRAGPGGSVLAIDADLDNARLLVRTAAGLDRGLYAPVDVLCAAVTRAGERIARFQIAERSRSSNALMGFGHSQMGGVRQVRTVPAFSLDELLAHFPPPQVLKIDVEGAEPLVLAGADRVLSTVRPTIIIEVGESHASEVGQLLRGHRYRLFNADAPAAARQELSQPSWNTLAVPA